MWFYSERKEREKHGRLEEREGGCLLGREGLQRGRIGEKGSGEVVGEGEVLEEERRRGRKEEEEEEGLSREDFERR